MLGEAGGGGGCWLPSGFGCMLASSSGSGHALQRPETRYAEQHACGFCGSGGMVDVRWHVAAAVRCLAEALEFQGYVPMATTTVPGRFTSAGSVGFAAASGSVGESVLVPGTQTSAGSIGLAAAGNDEFAYTAAAGAAKVSAEVGGGLWWGEGPTDHSAWSSYQCP